MVEIFKTNVNNKRLANELLKKLNAHLPAYYFNFDLDDCDRILRVQSQGCPVECYKIIQLVKNQNITISLLED
jgi:hypothetical protein